MIDTLKMSAFNDRMLTDEYRYQRYKKDNSNT